jgi:hypothetical protein
MILYRKGNNTGQSLKPDLSKEPYLIINILLAGVILLVMIYSGIFSPDKNDYPVICIHEKLTGQPCVSCGLSHSFSLIVRGRIGEAYQWNIYGMRVFLFFFLQFFLRTGFSLFYIKYTDTRRQLVLIDSAGSGLLFLIAFWPFIVSIFSGL